MSRERSNTMKAPALGRSSKPMRRPNSTAEMQLPEGPPTCTAWGAVAPLSSRRRVTEVPNGAS